MNPLPPHEGPMTYPCEQKDAINRIGETVESIHTVVLDLAIQNQRLTTVEAIAIDHESRIRKIEKTPLRVIYWVAAIVATIVSGFFTHKFWG